MPIPKPPLGVALISTMVKMVFSWFKKKEEVAAIVVVSFELAEYCILVPRRGRVAVTDHKKEWAHRQ